VYLNRLLVQIDQKLPKTLPVPQSVSVSQPVSIPIPQPAPIPQPVPVQQKQQIQESKEKPIQQAPKRHKAIVRAFDIGIRLQGQIPEEKSYLTVLQYQPVQVDNIGLSLLRNTTDKTLFDTSPDIPNRQEIATAIAGLLKSQSFNNVFDIIGSKLVLTQFNTSVRAQLQNLVNDPAVDLTIPVRIANTFQIVLPPIPELSTNEQKFSFVLISFSELRAIWQIASKQATTLEERKTQLLTRLNEFFSQPMFLQHNLKYGSVQFTENYIIDKNSEVFIYNSFYFIFIIPSQPETLLGKINMEL
jgi:hypothetical protein